MFNKITGVFGAFFALMLGMIASAHAALPASVGTAFTQVQTDAGDLRDLAIPVVVAVLGMTLLIKLIKRFGNKI